MNKNKIIGIASLLVAIIGIVVIFAYRAWLGGIIFVVAGVVADTALRGSLKERTGEEYYYRCDCCSRIIRSSYIYWRNDSPYCENCYDDFNDEIEDHDYKPEPIFYGKGNRYLGVELEVDHGGKDDENAVSIKEVGNYHDEHIYIKSDSSLGDGFEIVSHPMTLGYHMNEMDWEGVLNDAVRLGYCSHQTSTCGLHIHVKQCGNKELNKDYLDAYIIKLLRQRIFNKRSMRKHVDALNRFITDYNSNFDAMYASLKTALDEVTQGLDRITDAIEHGMITDSLMERAEHLEKQRAEYVAQISRLQRLEPVQFETYSNLIHQFCTLPHDSRDFKELVQRNVYKIVTYPYYMEVTLDLGFGVTDKLTDTITIRRGDLYAMFE